MPEVLVSQDLGKSGRVILKHSLESVLSVLSVIVRGHVASSGRSAGCLKKLCILGNQGVLMSTPVAKV